MSRRPTAKAVDAAAKRRTSSPPKEPVSYLQMIAALGATEPPRFPHKAYEPLKGVLPEGAKLAQDSTIGAIEWANQMQGIAYGSALNSAWAEGMIFPGYPYLAELAQRAEYRRGAEIIATELTREWITLGSKKEGDDKSERIEGLLDALDRFKVRDKFRRAAEIDGIMGRAQIFLDLGQGNVAAPLLLTPETVKKGSLRALTVVEPMWSYPAAYNSIDPLSPDFYRPPAWYVMGKTVSSTRLLTFIGREVPDLLKPSYAFGGLSMTQMAKPYVDNWLRTRQAVSDLINNFSKVGIATDLGAVTSGECTPDNFANRMAMFNLTRSNRGLMVLDKTSEEMFELSTPLSGLNDLQSSSLEQVCAVYGIPQVIYLQLAPGGLNTNSEGVIRTFYDAMHAKQEDYYRDPLQRTLDLLQLNEFGDIDPDITFSFNPLWQMSSKEKAEERKIDAETAAIYVTAGIVDPVEERERLAADGEGIYRNLDLSKDIVAPGMEDDPTEEDIQAQEGGGDNAD